MPDWKFESKPLEADEENKAVAWAENHGWVVRPMSYRGRRGCPDRWFFGFGKIVIIEFKRPEDGHLSGNQVKERARLAECGIVVHVVNDWREAIAILQRAMP